MSQNNRVPPLNLTAEERGTLIHCIVAGEEKAVEHFGEEEAERIELIKEKLDYPVRGREEEPPEL